MTTPVADEVLGQLARMQNDLFRRVREGSLEPQEVFGRLQEIIEGRVIFTHALWARVHETLGCSFDESFWVEPTPGFWDVYVQKGVTPNKVVAALRQLDVHVLTYVADLDSAVTVNDRDPAKDAYRVRFRANVEADSYFQNKSANQLKEANVQGITLAERLLLELAYYLATENQPDIHARHLDPDTATICSGSRYSGGGVPIVGWSREYRLVCVHCCFSAHRHPRWRTRVAVPPTP